MKQRVALYLQDSHDLRDGLDYVRYAEEKGFEAVWQAESRLVRDAIARKLAELQDPASATLARLKRLAGAEVQAMGLKFGFKLDRVGAPLRPGPVEARVDADVQLRSEVGAAGHPRRRPRGARCPPSSAPAGAGPGMSAIR